jgi:hypothetical protein
VIRKKTVAKRPVATRLVAFVGAPKQHNNYGYFLSCSRKCPWISFPQPQACLYEREIEVEFEALLLLHHDTSGRASTQNGRLVRPAIRRWQEHRGVVPGGASD